MKQKYDSVKKADFFFKSYGFCGSLLFSIPWSGKQGQSISDPYHNSWHREHSLKECIECMGSPLKKKD